MPPLIILDEIADFIESSRCERGIANGCGAKCCDPVVLPYSQDEVRAIPANKFEEPADRRFVLEDLTPLPYLVGAARAPHAISRPVTSKEGVPATLHFYSCRWFDEETKACGNYENRPPLCRTYPWYGREPNPRVALPHRCDYQKDIPIELIQKP